MHPTSKREKHLLFLNENLTGWVITRTMSCDIADVVISFVKEEIIFTFEPPRTNISDNARCFTASTVRNVMSNSFAERVVGTINRSVAETMLNNEKQ